MRSDNSNFGNYGVFTSEIYFIIDNYCELYRAKNMWSSKLSASSK